ncbi:MAG: hypothetical protein FWH23_05530 [Bacteroidales bacterium]|nr:hypothetical protein [Bacteroidales bacterium]MCL2132899.1 hypothetical protein [Bacteroidales bacterium]
MKKILLFVGVIVIATVSCTNYKDVSFEHVGTEDVSFQSTSKINLILGLKVNNPTKKKLTLTEGTLELFQQNRNLGTIVVSEPMVIAPKSNDYKQLKLNVTIKDFMALIGINMSDSNLLEQFDVEGFIKVKAGMATKKLNVQRTNFNNLLQSL